jgi:hypothetical protein
MLRFACAAVRRSTMSSSVSEGLPALLPCMGRHLLTNPIRMYLCSSVYKHPLCSDGPKYACNLVFVYGCCTLCMYARNSP